MKPRTPIQQEVARLSERLPKLTATQRAYAFRHCFKHYAIKRADGTNICTECGHSWKSEHDLADTVCGCTCPHCGMELEALRTRKRVFNENEYFCIITTCKQYQVIRFFFVKSRYKAGQAAGYSIYEVVQRWISAKGTTVTVARLRGMSILYYDLWAEYSDMEVRKNNKLRAYDINPVCTYPRQRFIPELKRNGFNGEYHNILPYDLFTAILSDSRAETLLKAGQYPISARCKPISWKMRAGSAALRRWKARLRGKREATGAAIWRTCSPPDGRAERAAPAAPRTARPESDSRFAQCARTP